MQIPGRLIVDVARLSKDGEHLTGETAPDLLDLGQSDFVTPLGGMHYALRVEQTGSNQLLVRGMVRQQAKCVWSRCATDFVTEIVDDEFFTILEITALTEFVDLTPDLREAIILALPGYPVCHEACRGLCSQCGADLNQTTCKCCDTEKGVMGLLLDTVMLDAEK